MSIDNKPLLHLIRLAQTPNSHLQFLKGQLTRHEIAYHQQTSVSCIPQILQDRKNHHLLIIISSPEVSSQDFTALRNSGSYQTQIYCYPYEMHNIGCLSSPAEIIRKYEDSCQKLGLKVNSGKNIQIKSVKNVKNNASTLPYKKIAVFMKNPATHGFIRFLEKQAQFTAIYKLYELTNLCRAGKSLIVTELGSAKELQDYLVGRVLTQKLDVAVLGISQQLFCQRYSNIVMATQDPLQILQYIKDSGFQLDKVIARYQQELQTYGIQNKCTQHPNRHLTQKLEDRRQSIDNPKTSCIASEKIDKSRQSELNRGLVKSYSFGDYIVNIIDSQIVSDTKKTIKSNQMHENKQQQRVRVNQSQHRNQVNSVQNQKRINHKNHENKLTRSQPSNQTKQDNQQIKQYQSNYSNQLENIGGGNQSKHSKQVNHLKQIHYLNHSKPSKQFNQRYYPIEFNADHNLKQSNHPKQLHHIHQQKSINQGTQIFSQTIPKSQNTVSQRTVEKANFNRQPQKYPVNQSSVTSAANVRKTDIDLSKYEKTVKKNGIVVYKHKQGNSMMAHAATTNMAVDADEGSPVYQSHHQRQLRLGSKQAARRQYNHNDNHNGNQSYSQSSLYNVSLSPLNTRSVNKPTKVGNHHRPTQPFLTINNTNQLSSTQKAYKHINLDNICVHFIIEQGHPSTDYLICNTVNCQDKIDVCSSLHQIQAKMYASSMPNTVCDFGVIFLKMQHRDNRQVYSRLNLRSHYYLVETNQVNCVQIDPSERIIRLSDIRYFSLSAKMVMGPLLRNHIYYYSCHEDELERILGYYPSGQFHRHTYCSYWDLQTQLVDLKEKNGQDRLVRVIILCADINIDDIDELLAHQLQIDVFTIFCVDQQEHTCAFPNTNSLINYPQAYQQYHNQLHTHNRESYENLSSNSVEQQSLRLQSFQPCKNIFIHRYLQPKLSHSIQQKHPSYKLKVFDELTQLIPDKSATVILHPKSDYLGRQLSVRDYDAVYMLKPC